MNVIFLVLFVLGSLVVNAEGIPIGNTICARDTKNVTIGVDYHGDIVKLDIGECRREETSRTDNYNGNCMPDKTVEERFYMVPFINNHEKVAVYGPHQVNVIETCRFQPQSNNCERLPFMRTFYKGTSFEKSVNLGVCNGQCNKNKTCEPVVRSQRIKSPNGEREVDVITECQCRHNNCYRKPQAEVFWEETTRDDGTKVIQEKIIDKGQCVGTGCKGKKRVCLIRNGSICELYGKVLATGCAASNYTEHRFNGRRGQPQVVHSIADCACGD